MLRVIALTAIVLHMMDCSNNQIAKRIANHHLAFVTDACIDKHGAKWNGNIWSSVTAIA